MRRRITSGLLAIACVLAVVAIASPPVSKTNPKTGNVESADSYYDTSDYDVRHTINLGNHQQEVYTVADHDDDDVDPVIEHDSDGNVWIAWWRDGSTDQVLARKRTESSGSWSAERLLSDAAEDSRNPRLAHDGTGAWVAFEYDDNGDTGIGVNSVSDEPDPIPNYTPIASTTYTGSVNVDLHFESNNLWVTWVDSSDDVGWSEYDSGSETWSTPAFEDYSVDSVPDARERIRTDVLLY